MTDPLDALPDEARDGLEADTTPSWCAPMLATLVHEPFSDPGWIFERKLDGERCLAVRRGRESRLVSRNGRALSSTWPEVRDALASQAADDFYVDGEIVAFEGDVTSFARLQERLGIEDEEEARTSGVRVYYYVFDVLWVDGHDLRKVALRHRKAVLRRLFRWEDPLRFTPHRNEAGEDRLREACAKGWEGLIAKKADSTYAGKRSRNWLKLKCVNEQELVVGGFTASTERSGWIGALLLGVYEGDDLVYAGRVGTGFDDEERAELHERLQALGRETSPFAGDVPDAKAAHWVRPDLVAQIRFTEWTGAGRLRHPRYLGLRSDKAPTEVRRERAARVPEGG